MKALFLIAAIVLLWFAMSGRLVAALNALYGTSDGLDSDLRYSEGA